MLLVIVMISLLVKVVLFLTDFGVVLFYCLKLEAHRERVRTWEVTFGGVFLASRVENSQIKVSKVKLFHLKLFQ